MSSPSPKRVSIVPPGFSTRPLRPVGLILALVFSVLATLLGVWLLGYAVEIVAARVESPFPLPLLWRVPELLVVLGLMVVPGASSVFGLLRGRRWVRWVLIAWCVMPLILSLPIAMVMEADLLVTEPVAVAVFAGIAGAACLYLYRSPSVWEYFDAMADRIN